MNNALLAWYEHLCTLEDSSARLCARALVDSRLSPAAELFALRAEIYRERANLLLGGKP
jgi:hypothetical protein